MLCPRVLTSENAKMIWKNSFLVLNLLFHISSGNAKMIVDGGGIPYLKFFVARSHSMFRCKNVRRTG